MGLFKPAWMSDNREKALLAVGKETDQVKLAEIAESAPLDAVRITAVEKLTDQPTLSRIASNASCSEAVRYTAVESLTDEATLAIIAKQQKEIRRDMFTRKDARKNAVEKLASQELIAEVSCYAPDSSVRAFAVSKLALQPLLIEIARKDVSREVRCAATRSITSPTALADIAINDTDVKVRALALDKITDDSIRAEIANRVKHIDVQCRLVDYITDDVALYDIFKSKWERLAFSRDYYAALRRIKNPCILREILSEPSNAYTRIVAAANLQDQEILEEMVQPEGIAEIIAQDPGYGERHIVSVLLPALENKELQQQLAIEFARKTNDVVVLEDAKLLIDNQEVLDSLIGRKESIIDYHDECERIRTAGGLFG